MKRFVIAAVVSASMIGCAGSQAAPKEDANPTEQAQAEKPMPQLTPEEMMQKMVEAGTPGKEHAALAPLVGRWKTTTKWYQEPGKPPSVDKGTATHSWIFGKRFIKQDFNGKWAGRKFQGTGLLGYDNVKKAYISTWTDNMSTTIATAEGTFDAATRSLQLTSKFSCPITGGENSARSVTRIVNDKEHVFEMFGPGPDGKEFKMMEITYKK